MARLQVVLLLGLLLGLAGAWAPGIPTGWETAPCTVQEFPNSTADPWRYSHRLGLYKLLLASTTQLHFDNGWGNPLWGLPLQFSWQHDTARLDSSASEQHQLVGKHELRALGGAFRGGGGGWVDS